MKRRIEDVVSLREKFETYFPGGHSNKRSVSSDMRTLVAHGQGSRLWDMDGTEYLDYSCSMGPNILGHRHPEYLNAFKNMMDTTTVCIGGAIGYTENDVIAAEKLIQHVPCAERVKFATSGTEAVQTAIRIARSHTKRPYVLMFEGHYHGWIDNTLGFEPGSSTDGLPHAVARKDIGDRIGRAPGAEEGTLMIEWNNIERLEQTLKTCGDEIACMIMEVFVGEGGGMPPRPGYLERVRELCDHYGIVLCFDEVFTGFRAGLNSAQGLLGVTPDLTTLGKALGGGMPISAVVGKAQVMDALAHTICPGTYMGHPLCVQGIVTSLSILERDNGAVYQQIENVQKGLMAGLSEIAQRRGIPLRVQGFTSALYTLFGGDPDKPYYSKHEGPSIDREMGAKFCQLIKQEGVICVDQAWVLNIMHSDEDTAIALEAADRAMAGL